jgi:hypothetical protein
MMSRNLRTALILLVTGTLASATQAALCSPADSREGSPSETCFSEPGMLDLSAISIGAPPPEAGRLSYAAADTLQTYEVELEDEGKKGVNYKAIVGFAIAAAFVGYALYILLVPEEEEETVKPAGKEPPVTLITFPFGG